MSELGNILEPEADGPRGPDLEIEVEVPRAALGLSDGYAVRIPHQIARAGGYVARVVSPHDEGEMVVLRLPEGFPDGGVLKLRGQGGAAEDGGSPGDLLVEVHLTGGALVRRDPTALAGQQMPTWMSVAGLLALIAALVAWALV